MRLLIFGVCLLLAGRLQAGSIFLTGHDPDFHAILGGNPLGAQNINQVAIGFVQDPAFNPFFNSGIHKFLWVESAISPPGGHTVGKAGIIASGYTEGVDFDSADASTLNAALNGLGTLYSAFVVASDYGGILTQAELNILNARSTDIISFLNAGGGLYALTEGNSGAGLTPGGGWYGFLPFVVSTAALNQSEIGNSVTPFGASLGLSNSDVNGNASHVIFPVSNGMNVVDVDKNGNFLSLAVRANVTPGGVVPEPGTWVSLAGGLAFVIWRMRRK